MKKCIMIIIALIYSFLGVQMLLADTTPNHFKFINQKNVALSTPIISNTITVSGIDAAAPISIAGGEYKINSGSYTGASGTVNNTDTVTLQVMSAASFSTTTLATLTIGGVSGTFSVKTLPADTKPDKFTFIAQTNVDLSTLVTSNAITVSGINTESPISIVGGTYSINSGPYTSAPDTVENGDTVTLQQTSAGIYNKKTTATLTIGKVKGAFSVTTLRLTKADLTGTWRINVLRTGSNTKWMRGLFSIDSSGVATCLSLSDSGGGTTCPSPFDLKFTMNSATGVITQSGHNAANTGNHMMMTSNKNFMAGTSTTGKSPNYSYQLAIMQKDTGASYSADDVRSKSFVAHALHTGEAQYQGWEYDAATTDAAGLVTLISGYDSSSSGGPVTPGVTTITLSVDSNGVVTMSGRPYYHGFLSDDKKTIVATDNSAGGSVDSLSIIQITGRSDYTADALFGTWYAHMLTTTPSWIHFTAAVAGDGVISFSHWVSSDTKNPAPTTTKTFTISSSGTVTIADEPSFHGQMSDDGKFMVVTQTLGSSGSALSVYTR